MQVGRSSMNGEVSEKKMPKRSSWKSDLKLWRNLFLGGSYLGFLVLEAAVVQCDDFNVKSKTMLRVKGYIEVPHHLSRSYSNAARPWKKTVPFQGPTVELRGCFLWSSHASLVFIHAWGAIFYAGFLWLAITALVIWFVCCEIRSTLQWCLGEKSVGSIKDIKVCCSSGPMSSGLAFPFCKPMSTQNPCVLHDPLVYAIISLQHIFGSSHFLPTLIFFGAVWSFLSAYNVGPY